MRIDFDKISERVKGSGGYFAQGIVRDVQQAPVCQLLGELYYRWDTLLFPARDHHCIGYAEIAPERGVDRSITVREIGSLRASMRLVTVGMRSLGFRRNRALKPKIDAGSFLSYWTHPQLEALGFIHSVRVAVEIPTEAELEAAKDGRVGAQCRRVQVDVEKKVVEVPIYKIVCFDETTGAEIPVSKAI